MAKSASSDDWSTRDLAQRGAVVAGLVLAVLALYFGKPILVPVALAVMLAFLLAPICDVVEKVKVPRVIAVVIVMLLAGGVIGGLGYTLYAGAAGVGRNLSAWQDNMLGKVDRLKAFGGGGEEDEGGIGGALKNVTEGARTLEEVVDRVRGEDEEATTQPADATAAVAGEDGDDVVGDGQSGVGNIISGSLTTVGATLADIDRQLAQIDARLANLGTDDSPLVSEALPPQQSLAERFGGYVGYVATPIGTLGLVIVFALFILLERDELRDKALRLISGGRLNVATQAIEEAGTRISRYLIAQAIVNGSYGLVISLCLLGLGYLTTGELFPYWALWGLLCAMFRYIPYLGPWLGAAFPIFVSFAAYDGFGIFLAVTGLFIVAELWSNNIMEPWLYGNSTGMSPLSVLLAATFWTFLWGVEGLILATPLTVCLVVAGKYVPQLKFFDILLRGDHVLPPKTRLYQRLIALDQEEALDIAEAYLEKQPLACLFDEVMLPALSMIENDRHAGALDESHQVFAHKVMRDMVSDLSDRFAAGPTDAEPETVAAGRLGTGDNSIDKKPGKSDGGKSNGRKSGDENCGVPRLPPPPTVVGGNGGADPVLHALVLPARDEADEIAGHMLARVMTAVGYRVTVHPHDALVAEMADAVRRDAPAAVVISAVPPAGLTHSRYTLKRLVAPAAENRSKILVALWTSTVDPAKARRRLTEGETTPGFARTLEEAVAEIRQAAAAQVSRRAEAADTKADTDAAKAAAGPALAAV